MRRFGVFLATCGGLGYAPVAPGTVGSAAGLLVVAALRASGSVPLEALAIVVVFAAGIWAATEAERHFGGVDPGAVVLDEVLGMLITLAFLPVTVAGALVGFLIFRVFDVVKPWPARRFERWPGGLGVMADDAMAAVYAHVLMRVLLRLAPAGWLAA